MTRTRRRLRTTGVRRLGLLLAVPVLALSSVAGTSEGGDDRTPRAVDDPAVTSGLAWNLEAIGRRRRGGRVWGRASPSP